MEIKSIGKLLGGQDGALWGDYLFRFDTRGNCSVYSFGECPNEKPHLYEVISQFTLDKADSIMPHSNSVAFGKEHYCEGDEFPLLYTNIYNSYAAEGKMKGVTCVYRIQRKGTQFFSQLVQLIEVGFVEDPIWRSENTSDVRPYGNFAIDRNAGIYYAFTMRDEDHTTRYFSFPLPKLHDGVYDEANNLNRVVLETSDIIGQFDCDYHCFIQGAAFQKGCIYSLEGFSNSAKNPAAIRIIDTQKRMLKAKYMLSDYNLTIEPEMIDFKGETCYYSDAYGNLYQLEFE